MGYPITYSPMIPFAWDWRGTDATDFGSGIVIETATSDEVGEVAWECSMGAAMGIYERVSKWLLSGPVTLWMGETKIVGSFGLTLNAVKPDGVTLIAEERDLIYHGGWYGESDESASGWTFFGVDGDGDPFSTPQDMGLMTLRMWRSVVQAAPGSTVLFPRPELTFGAPGAAEGFRIGRRTLDDVCAIVGRLPKTYNGSWDGSELATGTAVGGLVDAFGLHLGAPLFLDGGSVPVPGVFVEGELTLKPVEWWGYPGDVIGPWIDHLTGKWIRTPPLYDPALVES